MILVDRAQLNELLAGRTVLIPDPDLRYQKGAIYDVGTRRCSEPGCDCTRTMLCRAIVIKIEGALLRIQVVYQQQDTMLTRACDGGYTDDPSQAMFMEPAAVGPEVLEVMRHEARERWKVERRRRQVDAEEVPLHERLKRLEEAYQRGETSVEGDLRVVRQRIAALEAKESG